MAQRRTVAAIESEISRVKSDMSKIQDKYDKLAARLKDLQQQKLQIEVESIMAAYAKSGKSYNELMTFLQP